MSNHNLFIHGADGVAEPATSEQILSAARQVLSHRVRRGATLDSPQKVREYLSMRLGYLDYEVFGLILVDSHHRVIEYVKLFRGTIDGASVHSREVVKLSFGFGVQLMQKVPFSALRRSKKWPRTSCFAGSRRKS